LIRVAIQDVASDLFTKTDDYDYKHSADLQYKTSSNKSLAEHALKTKKINKKMVEPSCGIRKRFRISPQPNKVKLIEVMANFRSYRQIIYLLSDRFMVLDYTVEVANCFHFRQSLEEVAGLCRDWKRIRHG